MVSMLPSATEIVYALGLGDDLADLPSGSEEIARLIVAARRRDRRKIGEDQETDADEPLFAFAGIQEHPPIADVRQNARGHDDDEVDGGRDPADRLERRRSVEQHAPESRPPDRLSVGDGGGGGS